MEESPQYGYLPNSIQTSRESFNALWDTNESHLYFPTNGAQPSHAAPFFNQASFSLFPTNNLPNTTQLRHMNMPSRPASSMRGRWQQDPPAKRQRFEACLDEGIALGLRDNDTHTIGPSECCSSCPDGEPCTEPNCAPWDKLDLNASGPGVVPCSRQSCAEEACPDPCLPMEQQLYGQFGQKRVGDWGTLEDSFGGNMKKGPGPRLNGVLDPDFGHRKGISGTASPISTPPSMGHNDETPFSPTKDLSTPQFAPFAQQVLQSAYSTDGLGTGIFNTQNEQWPSQSYGQFANDDYLYHCTWDGCGQTIMNSNDLLPHLHSQHIDPQMTFNCPIQQDSCPPTINDNPLNHLQKDHGYNFDLGDRNIGCPAPTCVEGGEVFCNPAMLHQHFDSYHAIPNQGLLQCQLNTCNTYFEGLDQLTSHFINEHQLPLAIQKDDDINLQLTAPAPRVPKGEAILSNANEKDEPIPEIPHSCKWKDATQVCGKICTSEDDLQTHIKNEHLASLDKSSGYRCQWDGCVREKSRGEGKSGFSQRGKLERHMATHTGFKCCQCEVCGQTFSAQQSLAQHKLLHTGEKPWKCGFEGCGKAFPQQSALSMFFLSLLFLVPYTFVVYLYPFHLDTYHLANVSQQSMNAHTQAPNLSNAKSAAKRSRNPQISLNIVKYITNLVKMYAIILAVGRDS